MSADTGIYIAKFSDGYYRISYTKAIENIECYGEITEEYLQMLRCYFGPSELYNNKEIAILAAHKLEEVLLKREMPIEYGIKYIGEYPYWKNENEYLGEKFEVNSNG